MGTSFPHLGIVWVFKFNRFFLFKAHSMGMYMVWLRYGFPQNISILWEFVRSQTVRIARVLISSKSER